MRTQIVRNHPTEGGHHSGKRILPIEKDDLVQREKVEDAIVQQAVLKEQMHGLRRSFDKHVDDNRHDFRELHKRISDLRDDINNDLESHQTEAKKMMQWRWMLTGVLTAFIFIMTALQTYSTYIASQ